MPGAATDQPSPPYQIVYTIEMKYWLEKFTRKDYFSEMQRIVNVFKIGILEFIIFRLKP